MGNCVSNKRNRVQPLIAGKPIMPSNRECIYGVYENRVYRKPIQPVKKMDDHDNPFKYRM